MSYAVALGIAQRAATSAPRRIEQLAAALGSLEEQSSGGSNLCEQDLLKLREELDYLQRLVKTMKPGTQLTQLSLQVENLRRRYDALQRLLAPARSAAPASSPASSTPGAARLARGPVLEEEEADPSLQHLASFLHPTVAPRRAEDEVRLQCAEGSLSAELSKHPSLACTESGCTVFFGNFGRAISWSEEDDQVEEERFRLAALELSQTAANLVEFTKFMATQVEQDQELLDKAEEQMQRSNEATAQAVLVLAKGADRKTQLVLPSLGLVMVGGMALTACPAASALCAASRGILLLGAGLGSYGKLSQWQEESIRQLQKQLPRAFKPLPSEQAEMIRRASVEAKDRLQRKLDPADTKPWTKESLLSHLREADVYALRREVWQEVTVSKRSSDARKDGFAYLASFREQLAVDQAFRILQHCLVAGSVDPGCKVMWSRPVNEENGCSHSIRYLAFTDWFISRDFYCTCFCGPIGEKRYVMAMMSLGEELLKSEGLPQPTGDQGTIYVLGVRLTGISDDCTSIEVMIDTDPAAPFPYTTHLVNKRVRSHARNVAWLLHKEFRGRGKQRS